MALLYHGEGNYAKVGRESPVTKDKVILLVEDNPDDVKLTLRCLKKNNLSNEVLVAWDGEQALDYLFGTGSYEGRDPSVVPQVILLDLGLPKMDGFEVLERIRSDERTSRLPVVVLTSSAEEQACVESYVRGANSCVRKPVDFMEFHAAVKQLGVYWIVLNETSEG
jgi:two-component system response regulator